VKPRCQGGKDRAKGRQGGTFVLAQVTTAQVQPEKTDDVIRVFQDVVAVAAVEQQGFGGSTLLTDADTGKVLSVSLWIPEADLIAAASSGAEQEQLAKVNGFLAGSLVREVYEGSVQVEMTEQGTVRRLSDRVALPEKNRAFDPDGLSADCLCRFRKPHLRSDHSRFDP
jgi:heme-degrading monooxygenase HmoA